MIVVLQILVSGKDFVLLNAIYLSITRNLKTQQRRLPAQPLLDKSCYSGGFLKKLTSDDLPTDENKVIDTKSINEKDKKSKPKFRKLTKDQEEFLNKRGRYAPYRPVRTAAVEEEEDDEEYVEEEEKS